MEKSFLKNRKGQNLSIILEESISEVGLAFVMHGLGGFKEQAHIQTIADAFKEKSFTVVRFDAANTVGESDGKYEDATITTYYEDLEDVIAWAKIQPWYQEPFALSGHSLGGICTALYAEKHPEQVCMLAPISPVVSGALSVEANRKDDPEGFADWEHTGWQTRESRSKPGVIKRLPWSHIADRLKYDLLPEASKLTMPVLLITGENDTLTPPEHINILYNALGGPKRFVIIPDAPHTFRDEEHLKQIKLELSNWIDSYVGRHT